MLKTPVAVNSWLMPGGTDVLRGDSRIETRVGAVTCRLVEPTIVPEVALTVVVPIAWPVASPVLSIDASPPEPPKSQHL